MRSKKVKICPATQTINRASHFTVSASVAEPQCERFARILDGVFGIASTAMLSFFAQIPELDLVEFLIY